MLGRIRERAPVYEDDSYMQQDTPETVRPRGTLLAGHNGHGSIAPVANSVVQTDEEAQAQSGRNTQRAVTVYLFREGEEPENVVLDDVPALLSVPDTFIWADLSGYSEQDLQAVADVFHLSRGAVHTILSPWHRPWLQVHNDHFSVSATLAEPDSSTYRVRAGQFDIVVGDRFIVTAHRQPLPFRDQILARSHHNPDFVRLSSSFMLYISLDELLAYYEELNRHIQVEIETLEERALRATSENFLEDLLRFKRYAFAFSQLADQHREIFAAFLRPDFRWVSGDDVEMYFRDLNTRLARLLDALLDARDAVNGAFEIYVSHVSHRTNQIIKLLTMVSTVLLPTTVVIGLFGVSFNGVLPRYGPLWFVAMLCTILLITSGTVFVFRRRDWL